MPLHYHVKHTLPFLMALLFGLSNGQPIQITGTVVDSSNSQPISGALVKLVQSPSIIATTAGNGTFTLSGTVSVAGTRKGAATAGKAVIHGTALVLSNQIANSRMTVEAYSSNGALIARKSAITSSDGSIDFTDLLKTPGLYHIRIRSGSTMRFLIGFGLNGMGTLADFSNPVNGGYLGKAAAAYTVRVSKTGYVTKDAQAANETANVGAIRLAQEQEQLGVWVKVTPAGADTADLSPSANSYGMGSIVGDPARPSDMYVGGSASGLWKSTDYGKTWTKINSTIPNVPRGTVIAVAGTTPPTVWAAGYHSIYKSTDGGTTFKSTNEIYDPYSIVVDPYDNTHLISGLHEAAGVIESTDGGATWLSAGSGTLGGGVSVYPFFINTGNSASTRVTWFAIGQNGSNAGRTTNGGATWVNPTGIGNLEHPHGNAQIFQKDSMIWVAGSNGAGGQGVYRSADYGKSWSKADSGNRPEAIVWGTDKFVYAMYAWACSKCNLGTNFERAPLPSGTAWTTIATPGLIIGPNTVAVAYNGTHWVFVGCFWSEGLWRYVEP